MRIPRGWLRFIPIACAAWMQIAQATVYEVGEGDHIADVPWDTLTAGDTVLIHARTEPYKEKWVICRTGTEAQPITVRGVPDSEGNLPLIDGIDALTPTNLNYWNEPRGVIKVGGANKPSGSGSTWVTIENLEIKSGRDPYTFTGRDGIDTYAENAAAIYLEDGQDITIRNCIMRDCGNGLFAASACSNIVVEGCYIYDNGISNSIYHHNNYTEAKGITFQHNRFGPLRTGCRGNNLKDRSAGLVVRYNWIEGGNRQLDLVDSDHASLINLPEYRTTEVYGNILIEPDGAGNSQVCHYGGDSDDPSRYRKGTLSFHHNTIVSTRSGNTTLLRLSSNSETADCRNNVIYTTATGNHLAIVDNTGTANLHGNWLKSGWRVSHSNSGADVNDITNNITGSEPAFLNFGTQNFGLSTNSSCINAAEILATPKLQQQYLKHQSTSQRLIDGSPDIGAFEMRVDTDSDGIADDWEWGYVTNLVTMNATSHQDGDSIKDLDEYIAGTNPTNTLSVFKLSVAPTNQSLQISWPGSEERTYILSECNDLEEIWRPLQTNTVDQPSSMSYTNTAFTSNKFYRVEAQLE